MVYKQEFGLRLMETRLENGLSQEQLANKAHVTRNAISMYENGHRLPTADTIKDLSNALGVSCDYLIKGE